MTSDDAKMSPMTDALLENDAPGDGPSEADSDNAPDTRGDSGDSGSPVGSPVSRSVGRLFRRPLDWATAPWPAARIIRVLVTFALVGGSTWAALGVIHPGLVLSNNTPTGGDMGAHVMGPAYLRDHLLPNLQLSGWSNYWYAGFPMYRFYMVTPALMIVILNVVLPYGIAF